MKLIKVFVGIILVIITYYSLRLPGDESLPTNDKVGHFLAYSALSFNLLLLCNSTKQKVLGILFAIGYGLLMEFCQGLVPERDPSVYDMMANSTGVLIGFVLVKLLGRSLLKFFGKFGLR
jgi:VanZ family protein